MVPHEHSVDGTGTRHGRIRDEPLHHHFLGRGELVGLLKKCVEAHLAYVGGKMSGG